jgi:hypothetical protein
MPTADAFNALGAGNGFANCPTKIDVSSFAKWQTLGGFKDTDSGSPTAAQIALSLENAMRIYWNLNGLNPSANSDGVVTAGSPSGGTGIEDVSAGVPKTRVCGTDVTADPKIYNLPYSDTSTSGNNSADVDVNIFIVRMYDGVTTDEDNFVGHGISAASNNPAIKCVAENDPPAQGGMSSVMAISSYLNPVSSTVEGLAADLNDYVDISYGSGVSMPMVISLAVGANAIIVSGTTLSKTPPRAYIYNDVSGFGLYFMETKFFGLDLYTY